MNVCLPAHASHSESELARLVEMPTVWKGSAGELPQDVVQPYLELVARAGFKEKLCVRSSTRSPEEKM
jgi:hypothetical protein